jgi:hypothetical protein
VGAGHLRQRISDETEHVRRLSASRCWGEVGDGGREKSTRDVGGKRVAGIGCMQVERLMMLVANHMRLPVDLRHATRKRALRLRHRLANDLQSSIS